MSQSGGGIEWVLDDGSALPGTAPPPLLDEVNHGRDRRRVHLSRRQLIALTAVVLVAVGGLLTALQLRGKPPLPVTFNGMTIDHPGQVLATGEGLMRTQAQVLHGVVARSSRCYFDRAKPSGTDVDTALECGPVLLYDSLPGASYFEIPFDTRAAAPGHLTLTVNPVLVPERTTPLPANIHLVRPDRKHAPSGNAGLHQPVPPSGEPNVLTEIGSAGIPALHQLPADSALGSYGVFLKLVASGTVPFYGTDRTARSAAPGQRLVAFVIDLFPGDAGAPLFPHLLNLGLSVDGGAPRRLSLSDNSLSVNQYMIASVPASSHSLDLVLTDHGYTQRMSILTGAAAPGAIEVYRRHSVDGVASNFGIAAGIFDDGSGPIQTQLQIIVSSAHLYFFVDPTGAHPTSTSSAFLNVQVCYQPMNVGDGTTCYAFRGSDLFLDIGGKQVPAHDVGDGTVIMPVWQVPASFRGGTVTIKGGETSPDGFRLTITQPFSFPVTFS